MAPMASRELARDDTPDRHRALHPESLEDRRIGRHEVAAAVLCRQTGVEQRAKLGIEFRQRLILAGCVGSTRADEQQRCDPLR
jgi:hypothetical protein